jgi:hypothetical protein
MRNPPANTKINPPPESRSVPAPLIPGRFELYRPRKIHHRLLIDMRINQPLLANRTIKRFLNSPR